MRQLQTHFRTSINNHCAVAIYFDKYLQHIFCDVSTFCLAWKKIKKCKKTKNRNKMPDSVVLRYINTFPLFNVGTAILNSFY